MPTPLWTREDLTKRFEGEALFNEDQASHLRNLLKDRGNEDPRHKLATSATFHEGKALAYREALVLMATTIPDKPAIPLPEAF